MNRAAREEKLRAVPPASAGEPPIGTAPPGKSATASATGRRRGLNLANRQIAAIGHIPMREKLLRSQRFENYPRFQCFGYLFKR